jgi:two-component system, response regulator FlrC
MDVRLQSKLLRSVQERVTTASRLAKIDIRIIATSSLNFAEAVREDTFRQDLLFRLN